VCDRGYVYDRLVVEWCGWGGVGVVCVGGVCCGGVGCGVGVGGWGGGRGQILALSSGDWMYVCVYVHRRMIPVANDVLPY